jgi:hypothetical protein
MGGGVETLVVAAAGARTAGDDGDGRCSECGDERNDFVAPFER